MSSYKIKSRIFSQYFGFQGNDYIERSNKENIKKGQSTLKQFEWWHDGTSFMYLKYTFIVT